MQSSLCSAEAFVETNVNMTDTPSPSDAPSGDRVVLELPGGTELRGVASLVLGGIGSRIDLPYEKVDELQLAVLTLLGASEIESATIEVEIADTGVLVRVGPLPPGTSSAPGLQTVLERLVDSVESSPRAAGSEAAGVKDAGGEAQAEWVTLRLARPRAA